MNPSRQWGLQCAAGEGQRNSSRKNEEAEPKQKWHPVQMWLVVKVKSDAVKDNIARNLEC